MIQERQKILEIIDYYLSTFLSPPTSRLMGVEKSKLVIDDNKDLEQVEEIFWKFMESDFAFTMFKNESCFDTMFAHTEFWNYISNKVKERMNYLEGADKGRCHYLLGVHYPPYQEYIIKKLNKPDEGKDKLLEYEERNEDYDEEEETKKEKENEEKNKMFAEIDRCYVRANQEGIVNSNCLLGHLNVATILNEKLTIYDESLEFDNLCDEEEEEMEKKMSEIENEMIPILKMLSTNNVLLSDKMLGEFYYEKGDYKQAFTYLKRNFEIFDEDDSCCHLADCYKKLAEFESMAQILKVGALRKNCSLCATRIVKHISKHLDEDKDTSFENEFSNLCHFFHLAAIEKDHYTYYNNDNDDFKSDVLVEKAISQELRLGQLKNVYKKYKDKIDFQEEYLRMTNIIQTSINGEEERKLELKLKLELATPDAIARRLKHHRQCKFFIDNRHKINFEEGRYKMLDDENRTSFENIFDEELEENVERKEVKTMKLPMPVKIAVTWAQDVIDVLTTDLEISPISSNISKDSKDSKEMRNNWMNQSTIKNWLSSEVAKICYDYLFTPHPFYNWKQPMTF
jgi:hypothetical protein